MGKQTTKFIALILAFMMFATPCFASGAIDDLVFTSQKYIVVTAVVLIIFAGIIVYLFYLEQKIKHLEEKLKSK